MNTLSPAATAHPGLPRLWRDGRVRAIAVQLIALTVIFGTGAWMLGNVAANFAALDKTFGFSFLWRLPANYDINQTLIDYSNRDSHLRAALVGLLNTGLVSVVAIALATLMGFTVGTLRLSRNWLAARLAWLWVEFARNTPLLLLILLFHGVIVHFLPHPRRALGVGDALFLTNRGFYMPRPLFEAGSWTVVLVLALGLAAAWFLRRRATSRGGAFPWWAGAALVAVPVAAACIFAGAPVAFDIPVHRGFNFRGGIVLTPEFVALAAALAFFTSGFIAETVRAGILSVKTGQKEAARALGLSEFQTLRFVVLPQAMRAIVPPLTSEYLALVKNSSLAIAIGYMDLVATLGGVTLTQTGREMEAMFLVLAIYLGISLGISGAMNFYNRRIAMPLR